MNKIEGYARSMGLTPLKRKSHPTGAEIFIAERYANLDPEYDKPHYQAWVHVSFGEDKPLIGQKLFFDFGEQASPAQRIAAAEEAAEVMIGNVVEAYGKEHG